MKFSVNEILVSYIKKIRDEKKMTLTAFSSAIGKSKSYVTKFDNCEFKTLTIDDFKCMFMALANENQEEAENFIDSYFYNLYENEYIKKNIDLSIDFHNYSNVVKEFDIPTLLIDKINSFLFNRNLSVEDLINYANENINIKKYSNYELIDYNEYVPIPLLNEIEKSEEDIPNIYIKFKLDKENIMNIFNKKIDKTNYYNLLAIANAYYLKDLEKINDEGLKSDKEIMAGMAAHNLLFNFQFCNLEDKKRVQENENKINEMTNNLHSLSNTMQSVLRRYIQLIIQIYKQDPFYIEDKFKSLDKNLRADAGFCIASLDLPIYNIKELNTENKKKLLNELSEVINRYSKDETYQNQIELI